MKLKIQKNISKIAINNINKHIEEFKFKNSTLNDEPIIANNIRPSKVSLSRNGISPCLTAKMGTGGNNVPVIYKYMRKFSIREFLKLMGFPDGYIIRENYNRSYMQIGNSIVIPVVELIARNLILTLQRNIQKNLFIDKTNK
ncbi:DNA cytosine methyltransferase [Mycoplasma sp. 5912]